VRWLKTRPGGTTTAPVEPAPARADRTSAAVPGHDDPFALYDEYVRGFDDIPTLTDPIAIPPPRVLPPEFRLGERKDVRKHEREDAATLREKSAREQAKLYEEYLDPGTTRPKNGKRRQKHRPKRRRHKK
jgi:hypothetical protein